MTDLVLLHSPIGKPEALQAAPARPLRIDPPESAAARDAMHGAMHGDWRPFAPRRREHHAYYDFAILDE